MPPTNIRRQSEPRRSQFRLWSLLIFVAVIALLLALTVAASRDGNHSGGCALCWTVVLAWAAAMRWPGVRLGAPLGVKARRAVGWFTSVIAGVGAMILLNVESPDLWRDIDEGLGAAALILGMVAASIVEAVSSRLEASGRAGDDDNPP